MNNIEELQDVIRKLHGCFATHVETVPVTEEFQGETIWQGQVEVFDIRGHPKAKKVYAWGHSTGDDDQGRRYVAVLELPPVANNFLLRRSRKSRRQGSHPGHRRLH